MYQKVEEIVSRFPSIEETITSMTTSEVFLGFAALSIIGGLFYILRDVPSKLFTFFKRFYTVELEVRNADPIYDSILQWLYHKEFHKNSRRLRVGNAGYSNIDGCNFVIYPGDGFHILWHRGRPVILNKSTSDSKSVRPPEKFILRTLGRKQNILFDIIEHAKRIDEGGEEVKIYEWTGGCWAKSAVKRPKSYDSIVANEGVKERIIDDMQWFVDSEDWYHENGIPYHRGYLLYGPPGTGKSSLVFLAASHFDKNICILNLNSIVSDRELQEAFREVDDKSILLIEDVDTHSVVDARSESLKSNMKISDVDDDEDISHNPALNMQTKILSLSGILNAMDGIASKDGRIMFMTTNDPSNLDSAFIRRGRVDLDVEVGYLEYNARKKLFLKFFPNREDIADAFASKYENVSPAEMQGLFMENLNTPDNLIN